MIAARDNESWTALDALLRRCGIVKVDGLREPEHAVAAAQAGADLIGFIFAPARRRVTPEHARACIAAAKAASVQPMLTVGVFVDEEAARIADVAAVAGLDAVQLHGDESPELAVHLPLPVLKAFNPRPDQTVDEVAGKIAAHLSMPAGARAALVDGYRPGESGGTGVAADWTLASALARRFPLILAGGLTPGNVTKAIKTVRPLGVDVSSGVEVDGVKDAGRIAAFVAAARGAFAEVSGEARG